MIIAIPIGNPHAGEFRTCGITDQGELWCWAPGVAAYQIPLPMKAAVD